MTPMTPSQERTAARARIFDALPSDARMNAYYYAFGSTGLGGVDRILSAIADAGKGCHNTEDWNEFGYPEKIQDAADALAADLRLLLSEPVASPATIAEGHPEHTCEQCGRRNVVWHAPSPIWNRVCRVEGEPYDPMLCPVCFIEKAEAAGVLATAWNVAPEIPEDADSSEHSTSGVRATVVDSAIPSVDETVRPLASVASPSEDTARLQELRAAIEWWQGNQGWRRLRADSRELYGPERNADESLPDFLVRSFRASTPVTETRDQSTNPNRS